MIFKNGSVLKNRPIHFHINITRVIRPVKRNMLSFSSTKKKTRYFGPQFTVSHKSDSSSKTNSSCCHKSGLTLKKIMTDLTKTLKKGWPILRHFEVNILLMDNLYEVKKKIC